METRYFDEAGPQYSAETVALSIARAQQLGLRQLVLATDTGKTARQALAMLPQGFELVVVSNPAGLSLPVKKLHDSWPAARAHRERIEATGVASLPASISDEEMQSLRALGAIVLRMDWKLFVGFAKTPLKALDMFSAGVRVAVACSVAAYQAGAVQEGELLALGGTGFAGGGADSAIVLQVSSSWSQWRILELLAKPRLGPPSET
ncbi:MAG: hypothetical protein RBU37_07550 [Myxococcota bacterium]|nr:hypothetical protein [Myxococcota bacterium]